MHDPERPAPWSGTGGRSIVIADLIEALSALMEGETDPVACLANTAAALYHSLPSLNWAGFYALRGRELVLGPFQGRPACTRIPLGRGVCGTAAAENRSIVVPDVAAFPGHIACDSASRSELVVPILSGEAVSGVLDLDSPVAGRFTDAERLACEKIAALVAPFARSLASGG